MLSNIVKDIIAGDAQLNLESKVNLFAENAKGDQYVLVLDDVAGTPHEPIEVIRQSDMQVLVVGWTMLEAKFKAERIYDLAGGISGTHTTTIGNGVVGTYTIKTVQRRPPIRLRWKGKGDFSVNFTLHYVYSKT